MDDMAKPGAELPHLFRLIWPLPGMETPMPAVDEWKAIDKIAQQHRLRPLLFARAQEDGWPVPVDMLEIWRAVTHRSALKALMQRGELLRIGKWLSDAGIDSFVLKGGAICWRGWFDPALRPMRDLDLLLDTEQALLADRILRERGYSGDAFTTVGEVKHLPGLVSPETGMMVELHVRLIDAPNATWIERDEAFRAAAIASGGEASAENGNFATLCDSDTLLHVILHAVLDHQFNTGPLLMLDIIALLHHGKIDWQRFWTTAEKLEVVRAAQLALRLAQVTDPDLIIDWCNHVPEKLHNSIVSDAAAIMVSDRDRSAALGWIGRIARYSRRERGQLFWFRLRHRAKQIPGENSKKIPIWQLVTSTLVALSRRSHRSEIAKTMVVARWLR